MKARGTSLRLAGLAALLACNACIVYPDRGFDFFGQRRGDTPAAARQSLRIGRTTREEVLCTLGQPEYVSPDGARFVYWTHVVRWVLVVYLVVDGAQDTLGDDCFLLLEFDAAGVLRAQREQELGFGVVSPGSGRPSPAQFETLFEPAPR